MVNVNKAGEPGAGGVGLGRLEGESNELHSINHDMLVSSVLYVTADSQQHV